MTDPGATPRGLYALKPWYSRRLALLVRWAVARSLSPDLFTALGVLGAALAGVAIALGWWLPAAVLLAVRLAGANLDGAVARARGTSRAWGFTLNELGDRLSDLLMFAGLAVLAVHAPAPWWDGGMDTLTWVLLAALAATLPTFSSLAVAGAGGPRANGGPLGKTERCLLVVLATAWPSTIAVVCVVIAVGSVVTAVLRLRAGHRTLVAPGSPPARP